MIDVDANDPAMRRVYISGPMTGVPLFNVPAFNLAAAHLRGFGFHVENPAESPHCDSWQGYMRLALVQIARCDWLYMLPGWSGSKGALIEHRLAVDIGLRVVYAAASPVLVPVLVCGTQAFPKREVALDAG
jgi:hypothetical protein